MKQKEALSRLEKPFQRRKKSNVKSSGKYERFGETIRYLTLEEWQRLLECIEDYRHKLMLQMIYELGCRVGEFVRIQLKHLNFSRSTVLFPGENTKTKWKRTSHLPRGLMNEIVSMLKAEGRAGKRDNRIKKPDDYLFKPSGKKSAHYSENWLRQIFQHYVRKAGLDQEYGEDSRGRKLHQFTIHSLRHSHLMHYILSTSCRCRSCKSRWGIGHFKRRAGISNHPMRLLPSPMSSPKQGKKWRDPSAL